MAEGKSNALFDLLKGRARVQEDLEVHLSERDSTDLHAKMRQAYWWITNNAIFCPYYDVEFGKHSTMKTRAGDTVSVGDAMSYSSFVLIPMLTLFTCRRALLVGGPGRGKTTSAVLMALLAGISKEEIRRSILRGHPQLTIADMLGSPLPADMMRAENAADIKVTWRQWIEKRVKIVDEYNRIPTKTQSALLSLLAEGYAEMFDQYVHTGRSSWFLTANDDAGGGTFQVIEALKDRIDVVVRALPFHSGFVEGLLKRIEADQNPEDLMPQEIVFSKSELDAIYDAILDVRIPAEVLDTLAYFLGQLDFCRMASPQFEYKNKDTLKLAGQSVARVCTEKCPLDKKRHLCTQTENGVSARAFSTCLHFAKALAYFRGHREVEWEDIRQIVPWVLHDKLVANARSPFFQAGDNATLLQDRVSWIRNMIDTAHDQFRKHKGIREQVKGQRLLLDEGLVGVPLKTVEKRMAHIASLLNRMVTKEELSAALYEDVVHLKSMYSRYQNYAHWVRAHPGQTGSGGG
jgi:MoxR-like ATPase